MDEILHQCFTKIVLHLFTISTLIVIRSYQFFRGKSD